MKMVKKKFKFRGEHGGGRGKLNVADGGGGKLPDSPTPQLFASPHILDCHTNSSVKREKEEEEEEEG